jgi:tRNA (uracil-5-)-methyltransferase TRM9
LTTKDNTKYSDYDRIAESWYRLRHWTRFKKELDDIAARWRGGRLLNIGCGHGPDFLPFKENFDLFGLDSSEQMMKMAVRYAAKFKLEVNLTEGDAACLPFKDDSFDWAISVAAYHHIGQKQRRAQAFEELRRVLKPGGEAFITVWNRWQREFWNKGSDVIVPWKTGGKKILRYYHLFTYMEVQGLLKKSGFRIVKIFPEYSYKFPIKFFSRNICVLARAD